MNVFGVNNLAFAQAPAKGQSNTTPSKESNSFEDVLGQVQTSDSKAKALPAQPSAPSLERPTLNDRLMNSPNNIPLVNQPPQTQTAPVEQPQDAAIESLTRRAVWSDFLRKMRDDLGVSAEDVMKAFGSLSEEELAQPPSQSVDKIVMALGLDGSQAQMAKQHFMDLIQRTQPRTMGEELAQSQKQISLTLMSQREMDRKNVDRSIDNLNQNFFMKGPFERPAQTKPVESVVVPKTMTTPQAVELQASTLPQMPVGSELKVKPATVQAQGFEIPQELLQAESPKAKVDVDALVKNFTSSQGQSSFMAQQTVNVQAPTIAAESAVVSAPKMTQEAAAAMSQLFTKNPVQAVDEREPDFGSDQEFTSDASYLGAAIAGEGQSLAAGGPSEFQDQLNSVNTPQPMEVPDLVKNAQVMVNEGGGEMKVTLNPEGLGEVAMKVQVKDGKVNVQMVTESDEAKRMIERSLGDLKSQLSNNNLNVTEIKIDTATNLGNQLEQQYSDAQRQMAQQTMEQFRQDTQGWRRSFFDVPAAKVYKGQGEAVRDVQAPTTSSTRRANGARRLDLVA